MTDYEWPSFIIRPKNPSFGLCSICYTKIDIERGQPQTGGDDEDAQCQGIFCSECGGIGLKFCDDEKCFYLIEKFYKTCDKEYTGITSGLRHYMVYDPLTFCRISSICESSNSTSS